MGSGNIKNIFKSHAAEFFRGGSCTLARIAIDKNLNIFIGIFPQNLLIQGSCGYMNGAWIGSKYISFGLCANIEH